MEYIELGSSFEGFADYNGKSICVSASSADGKTLLFIVPERGDSYTQTNSIMVALVVLLILALFYYQITGLLIARAMAEVRDKFQTSDMTESPMIIFANGYVVFLTLFAIIALIASDNGWWTSFNYVFSRLWSKGVHLFYIWAALFTLVVMLCFEFLSQLSIEAF